jgi:hypothetical protein
VDLNWVKELADQANEHELQRQKQERLLLADEKRLALQTGPLVEKLHILTQKCAEEFNKYVLYPHLKITVSRLQKRFLGTVNSNDPELSYPEERFYFHFTRLDWLFAIRGGKGQVEFLELPQTADGQLSISIDQVGASPSRILTASIEKESKQLIWQYQERILSGEDIAALGQEYIKEFIERTKP